MGRNELLLWGMKLVIKRASLQQTALKLCDVVEVDLSAPQEFPEMIGCVPQGPKRENLVQISIKLALIFSPVTVSDTELVYAVIKAGMAFIIRAMDLFVWMARASLKKSSCIFDGAGQQNL